MLSQCLGIPNSAERIQNSSESRLLCPGSLAAPPNNLRTSETLDSSRILLEAADHQDPMNERIAFFKCVLYVYS